MAARAVEQDRADGDLRATEPAPIREHHGFGPALDGNGSAKVFVLQYIIWFARELS